MSIKYKKIKDIAIVHSGATPSTKTPEYWGGDVKWITPAELREGHNWYIYDTERKITELAVESKKLKLLKKGTVLLTSRAPIGKVALVGEPICTNQGFKNIECDTNVMNPEFLYFWLLGRKDYLNSLGRGATFKEISKKIVENIKVPIFSLDKQKKIVSIIKKSLNLIDKRESQIEALNQLTESIFVKMIGDVRVNNKGWNIVKLEELTKEKSDIVDGPFGSAINTKIDYVDDGVIPVIRTKNVGLLNLKLDDLKFIKREKYEMVKRSNVLPGDIVLTKVGTIGNICIFPNTFREAVLSTTGSCRIRVDEEKINKKFLVYYLYFYRDIMQNIASEGVQPFLNLKHIRNFDVFVPDADLQIKFSEIVGKIEVQKEALYKGLTEFKLNYESLMQSAFKGELFTD